MNTKLNRPPLFDDLDSVVGSSGSASKPVDPGVIKQVSETQNFPNRDARRASVAKGVESATETPALRPTLSFSATAAAHAPKHEPRRFRTGRNIPVNIKLDEATRQTLYEVASALNAPLGEVIERALLALKAELGKKL